MLFKMLFVENLSSLFILLVFITVINGAPNSSNDTKISYQGTCETDSDCDFDNMGLKCVDLKCICDTKISIYSEAKKSCVGLSDEICINNLHCVTNSQCQELCDNVDPKTGEKVEKDICQHKCLCPIGLGYLKSEAGLCLAPLDNSCGQNGDDKCLPGLTCIDDKCGCDKNVSQFSPEKGNCVGLVAQHCVNNELCVQNAECFYLCDNVDPKTGEKVEKDICEYKCLCPGDVLAEPPIKFNRSSPVGFCQAHYEGPCGNSNDNCIPGMICQEGHCKCDETISVYDPSLETCVGLLNKPCVNNLHCVNSTHCGYLCDNLDPKMKSDKDICWYQCISLSTEEASSVTIASVIISNDTTHTTTTPVNNTTISTSASANVTVTAATVETKKVPKVEIATEATQQVNFF